MGALYARYEVLKDMPPWQGGGDIIHTVSFERSTYADVPQRFEAGTPNIAGVVGMDAAIRYMQEIGMANIAAHEQSLLRSDDGRVGKECFSRCRFRSSPSH